MSIEEILITFLSSKAFVMKNKMCIICISANMSANVGINSLRMSLLGTAGRGRRAPVRRRAPARGRRVVRRRGSGFFGDVWNGIKKAANWVKDQKLISKGLNLIPDPRAKAAAGLAGSIGLGRRRRVRRRRAGGSFLSALKSTGLWHVPGRGRKKRVVRRRRVGGSIASALKAAHKYIKDKRLVSSALRHFAPKSNYHKIAHAAGYGRRSRRVRRRAPRRR